MRYAGSITCGRLVHCMPELNMYTVRPNDGGLTRFVARGIEDILPVIELETPLLPPTEAEWDAEITCPESSLSSAHKSGPLPTAHSSSCGRSSVHSPLYIDASVGFSPRGISVEEPVTSSGALPVFTGFPSNSPVSFTVSPTTSHSDSADVLQRTNDELSRFPVSTHSPGTPHSAPVVYSAETVHHCWDCGEAFDPNSTRFLPCSRCEPEDCRCENKFGISRTPFLSALSTTNASTAEMMSNWVDVNTPVAGSSLSSGQRSAFLNSLSEAVNLLLLLATGDRTSTGCGQIGQTDTPRNRPPSRPSMDALTAALLASPSHYESNASYDSSSGYECSTQATQRVDREFDQPQLPSACLAGHTVNMLSPINSDQRMSDAGVPFSCDLRTTESGHHLFSTNLTSERQDQTEECNFVYPALSTEDSHDFPSTRTRIPPSSNTLSTCSSSDSQASLVMLQAMQRLCTCRSSLSARVLDILDKLQGILTALAASGTITQSDSTPTFASVGTQSDQLDTDPHLPDTSACPIPETTGLPTPGTGGMADFRWPSTSRDGPRRMVERTLGTKAFTQLGEHMTYRSALGKHRSPSSVSCCCPESSLHTSVTEATLLVPHPTQSGPSPCSRRKQRALSESTSHTPVTTGLLLPAAPIAHPFPLKSDVKKCRKMYGIANRKQWCNQCRWKKACRRFPDVSVGQPVTTSAG